MRTLWQDLRYAARTLAHSPGFTIVTVLTLALGMGANTAIFSVVNAALLRPLNYSDADRLVVVRETYPQVGEVAVPYPDFLDWRQQSRTFAQMAAVSEMGFNFSGVDRPERIVGYAVSPNFLSLLGVRPALGRDLLPAEERPASEPVALLSYQLWQSRMGGDPRALGRAILLDGRSFTVVGVLPPDFRFTGRADLIAPIGVWAGEWNQRGEHSDIQVLARLAPGAGLPQARAEMAGIAARLEQAYPATNRGEGVHLSTLRDEFVGDTRTAILVLFGAVGFVMLIACVNVANLFLARGAARAREIAVRLALGAGRGRVVRQMLTESALLAALGGALGQLLGAWGVYGLGQLVPADSSLPMGFQMDRRVLLFAAALIVAAAAAFGLVPAWAASRSDVEETLKQGGRGGTAGRRQRRLGGLLVISETALALVLLAGAGLMMKSLYLLLRVDPGFRSDRVLTMEVDLRSTGYAQPAAVRNFWQQVLERVRAIPGVEAAAAGTGVPLTGDHDRTDITIEGQPLPGPGEFPHPDRHIVSAGYTGALSIMLLRGRWFTEADTESAPRVGLVNATLARRIWPGRDAVGKRFLLGHPRVGESGQWITIVGVAGDTKLYGLANPSRLEIYLPYRQAPSRDMNLVIRAAGDPGALSPAVRAAVAAVDKDQPVFAVSAMRSLVEDSVATRRATLLLLGLFSGLALALAAIGIYGVISYSVARRTHEIGIRMAVGARPGDIRRLVMGDGLRLGGAGILLGVAAALATTRWMNSLLYGIAATDATTYLGVALLLLAIAALACWVPARRAMRFDPLAALRED